MPEDSILQIDRITKVFGAQGVALQNVSFEVTRGELVHLVGPNQAGKTTLLKLVAAEERPTEGQIVFDGRCSRRLQRKDILLLRRKLGLIFPDFGLIEDMNVFDNVALGLRILERAEKKISSQVNRILNQVGLVTKRRASPAQLSSAERQMVAVARAMVKDPLLLLADEPTLNLDEEGGRRIMELLKRVSLFGTAVLVATRPTPSFDGHASKVIRIEKGRIADRRFCSAQPPSFSGGAD